MSAWDAAAARLAAGEATLVSLWGEPGRAHLALFDDAVRLISIECPEGRFPSVGRVHAPAIRLERAMHDLYGLEPAGLPDTRPWLDHGPKWVVAVGHCAAGCGVLAGSAACVGAVAKVVPVDLEIRGCPPSPTQLLQGLLALLGGG